MSDLKPWYASRSIWGSLVAVGAALAAAFGVDVDQESQSAIVNLALQVVTVAASIFAIIGRLGAKSLIE